MQKYINMYDPTFRTRETVHEFEDTDSLEYRKSLLAKYQLSSPSQEHYLSQRCCQDWNDDPIANDKE